jgi:quercetin dioxygenase-like cupin family protein
MQTAKNGSGDKYVPPGHEAPLHAGKIFDAQLEARQNGKPAAALSAGGAIHIPAGEPRRFVPATNRQAVLSAVTAPPVE